MGEGGAGTAQKAEAPSSPGDGEARVWEVWFGMRD